MKARFGSGRSAALMFGAILLLVAGFHATPLRQRLDAAALDATQRVVRSLAPRPAVEDVVIVGIDEETERIFPEPFALWHKHIGAMLSAVARGNPKLIALDLVLPERSADSLLPGLDLELIRGLVAAKHSGRLVIGLRLDAQGRPLKIDNMLLAAVGVDALGFSYATVDRDGTARRIELGSGDARSLPLFAERIALALGIEPRAGIIDFSCGKVLSYIPMQEVIAWGGANPARLSAAFADKIVLVGKVGPDEDALRQPLSLASWMPNASEPPGVVLLAQIVRSLQSGRVLGELPTFALAALVGLGASVVLIRGVGGTFVVGAVAAAGLVALAYFAYLGGVFLPPTSPLAAIALGVSLRSSLEAFEQRRARLAIEQQFGGYVSQNLLEALIAGEVDPTQPCKYSNLGFLFADIRGFTTMVEKVAPEEVLALLNRYYEAITPAIHQFDGTIDNFRGDGILAIFGAPRPADDGPRRAVLATREIFARLEILNAALVREGRAPLEIGIGLSAGDAVAGNVGTTSRHGYSAVGDAVNVSARLQSLCKPRGMQIIASEAIARTCGRELPFVALGRVELAGHAPVEAYGVPKVHADAANETPTVHGEGPEVCLSARCMGD